jgi:hypothetical protein
VAPATIRNQANGLEASIDGVFTADCSLTGQV